MLTKTQQYLFQELDLDPKLEPHVRQTHKQAVAEGRAVKDFTDYLTKRMHAAWKQNRIYLGD